MSEEFKAKVEQILVEAWNKGNLDGLDELYAADFVRHRPPLSDVEGLEAFKEYIVGFRSAFPDLRVTYDEMILDGDTFATRWTVRGTHTGPGALPFPPTGKQMTLLGCLVVHMEEGKFVEEWQYADFLGMLQQLGVVPPIGKSEE